ncbi:hypothetical protein PG995_014268 [Apiospora arundinis]
MANQSDLKWEGDGVDKVRSSHHEDAMVECVDDQKSAWRCIRDNPKISLWTLYANIGSIMIGYENLALSVALAMPAFQMTFASEIDGQLLIPAHWQSLWNAIFNVMIIAGSIAAGPIQDWFGRRAIFLTCILTASAGITVAFVSETPAQFLGGKILSGFALGAMTVGTQTYVSEIAPLPMRGIALSINTVGLNLGLLIAISSMFSRIAIMDPSAFRVVFAGAWAFPGMLALGLPFLPESPFWLHTVETERRLHAEAGTLAECFRGTDRRRTFITLACFYMQHAAGSGLASNAPYFLNQTGLPSHVVLMITQVGVSVGVVSALVNILLMMRLRHRVLIFSGLGVCTAAYLAMGVAGAFPRTNLSMTVVGIALQFSSLSYGPAIGAAMAIAGEVSSTRLRAKTLALGNAFGGIAGTVWQLVLPYLFNKDQADLGGNIGWIFFGIAACFLVLVYFEIPGTKGRTYEELDIMFEKRYPARAFEKDDVVAGLQEPGGDNGRNSQ